MNYPATIGIVGGGQLGKMLTLAAKKMGFFVIVTDPTPKSPAGQVADRQIVGDYKDAKTTRLLAKLSDLLTVEAEFVNDGVLQKIADKGVPVHPSPKTIGIIKDKLKQKEFLKKNKIATAPFFPVNSPDDIKKASKKFGYPMYLKARMDAYDGKGNYLISSEKDIDNGLKKLKGRSLYIERFIDFKKELAVMVARSIKGEVKVYPVVETIHKDSICDTVIAPAKISPLARKRAQVLATKTIKLLKGAGVFGFEMFLIPSTSVRPASQRGEQTQDKSSGQAKVLINEIAPRVHNSGHYTIEASVTSQFEQHIRAITGLPLGSTDMLVKSAVMKNILGTREGIGFPQGLERALRIPGVSYHLYGKRDGRVGRKMGHLTVVGDSVEINLKKASRARKALGI
ncbi:MAG: 5-(carboxyamino)imidazole ribonucleotide synthase [Candidatus Levybacteria bacterium]|nr:5-(carboxyamino)imidazole ribonucleotide synthase [Candidatus Levybacteria bacterium]